MFESSIYNINSNRILVENSLKSKAVKVVNAGAIIYVQYNDNNYIDKELGSSEIGTIVNCTGAYIPLNDGSTIYQTEGGFWANIRQNNNDWKFVSRTVSAISITTAQDYINATLANNASIFENNLFCARFASKLNNSEKQVLFGLQTRLMQRNEMIKNSAEIESKVESYPNGYIKWESQLNAFMQDPYINSVTTLIIISCVILFVTITSIVLYKKIYSESKNDVKFSKNLTRTLESRLTKEEREQLYNETAGLITAARIKEKTKSIAGGLSFGLIAIAAGLFFLPSILNEKNNGN
ncbi:MAG: hypothetical protein LBS50_08710 [Prevotellaceae bacterium]|jgi:hypothetical protein|nr:hypothetical protein [Prevotellaceae bacterium]